MTFSFLRLRPLAILAPLVTAALPAAAQGTAAEREACTEDAVKLCADTIPDVPRTTACMKAHAEELTPRCRAIVVSRPDRPIRPRTRRAERDLAPMERDVPTVERRLPPPEDEDEPGDRRYLYVAPNGEPAEAVDPMDRERARARIERLCDEDELDPETCALTDRALRQPRAAPGSPSGGRNSF